MGKVANIANHIKSLLIGVLALFFGLPCHANTFAFEEIKIRPQRTFEVFLGLGVPSLSSYGLTYYHGTSDDVGIRLQAGQGSMSGKLGYTDSYEEVLFFANRTEKTSDWEKFVGVGIGQQNLTIATDFTDNSGLHFTETEEIKKTYLTINMTVSMSYPSGFSLSSDFSLRYSMKDETNYSANSPAQANVPSTYKSIQRDFDLLKNLLACNFSFQVNLFRFSWYF